MYAPVRGDQCANGTIHLVERRETWIIFYLSMSSIRTRCHGLGLGHLFTTFAQVTFGVSTSCLVKTGVMHILEPYTLFLDV